LGARRHTHFALIGKFCEKRLSATIILTVDSCFVLNIEHIKNEGHINSIMNIDFLSVRQYSLTSSAIAECLESIECVIRLARYIDLLKTNRYFGHYFSSRTRRLFKRLARLHNFIILSAIVVLISVYDTVGYLFVIFVWTGNLHQGSTTIMQIQGFV
jgi:hypothetical protein